MISEDPRGDVEMRRPTYKSGHLDIKLPAKNRSRGLRSWKAWKRRWIVLHSLHDVTAGFAVVTLDIYNNSSSARNQQFERSTIYLEAVIHIQRVISRSHPYAFYVEARENAVYLAADCETETQEWIDVLRDVFWPRLSKEMIEDDVHTVAVTDAAFCTLFGVHGGACHLCLGKEVVILRCMHSGHVLLEWPIDALARTYVDQVSNVKDQGHLFIIEPRPHSSGWTTPLRLFNVRAQELVQLINIRMQSRKLRKLSRAIQLPRSSVIVDELPGKCQSDKIRPASFYDQPKPTPRKYSTLCTVRRQQSRDGYYDFPRFGTSFTPPPVQTSTNRQRSHSESHLVLQTLSNSCRHLARSSGSLSCNQVSSENKETDTSDFPDTTQPEVDCLFASLDSGFQFEDHGQTKTSDKVEESLQTSQMEGEDYSEVESEKFSILSEPLYEELDRYRKDINKLLGISIFDDGPQPPPLPPRRPRTVVLNGRENQKKDVIRFLGMEDPWAKRMVETQRNSTMGVRKKNLFHFLGVDGSQTYQTTPLMDLPLESTTNPSCQQKIIDLLPNLDLPLTSAIDGSKGIANKIFYDVPNPLSVVVTFSKYDDIAEDFLEDLWQQVEKELIKINNHQNEKQQTQQIQTISRISHINKPLPYFLHDKNQTLSSPFPEKLFVSILYYSYLQKLQKYFLKLHKDDQQNYVILRRRRRQLLWI